MVNGKREMVNRKGGTTGGQPVLRLTLSGRNVSITRDQNVVS